MAFFFLDFLTVCVLAVLGVFSVRRLIFGFTAIFVKPDVTLESPGSYQPFVTIFVPCHNEESVISRTLDALLNVEYPRELFEIVAIDDQSSDNTLFIIQEYERKHSQIHAFQRSRTSVRGKAAALNEAIKIFTMGEIIYVVDADHRPKSDALIRLVRHFSDPNIAAANGRCIPRNRYDSLISSYVYLENLVHNRITMYASDKLALTPAVLGSNVCTRRSLFDKIGFYDEERLTEDLGLTVRIYEHGYKVKYDVTSITEHEAPDSITNYILQHLRWNRAFNEVTKTDLRKILFNKKLPLMSRIEETIFSLGYLDRLFFSLALGLTVLSLLEVNSFTFPYWVWLIFIGIPMFEILSALKIEKEALSIYFRLPGILSMFFVDVFVAFKALFQDIVRKPAYWYKTPRTGDRNSALKNK